MGILYSTGCVHVDSDPNLIAELQDHTIEVRLAVHVSSGVVWSYVSANAPGSRWVPMSAAPASGTGTTLNVSNPLGTYYNMSAASASTSYSIGSVSLGGYAVSLINTVTEPTVVGATQIVGSNYITNRDMYLVVANNGVATQYWLEVIL